MGPGVWLGFVWVLASNLNGGESPLAEESASQLVRGCLLANFEPELLSKGKGSVQPSQSTLCIDVYVHISYLNICIYRYIYSIMCINTIFV